MHSLYILWSDSKSEPYIGYADDLERRLREHFGGYNHATKHVDDWRLIHSEEFRSRPVAVKRERFLKSGRGREVLKKILSDPGVVA